MKPYDDLVAGSGLSGPPCAYLARRVGRKCLVIDKRQQPGGSVCCKRVGGINVH